MEADVVMESVCVTDGSSEGFGLCRETFFFSIAVDSPGSFSYFPSTFPKRYQNTVANDGDSTKTLASLLSSFLVCMFVIEFAFNGSSPVLF